MKNTFTLEEQLKIAELAFEIYKENFSICQQKATRQIGMCFLINMAMNKLGYEQDFRVKYMPLFLALKPIDKRVGEHWWSLKCTDETRKFMFIYLIKELKRQIKNK